MEEEGRAAKQEERRAADLVSGPSISPVTATNPPPPLASTGIDNPPPILTLTGIGSDRPVPPQTSLSTEIDRPRTSTSPPIIRYPIPGTQDPSIAGVGVNPVLASSVNNPVQRLSSQPQLIDGFNPSRALAVNDPIQYPASREQSMLPPNSPKKSGKKRAACESLSPDLSFT